MKTFFEICFFFLMIMVPAQLYYNCVIRTVLLAKMELEVLRLRTKLNALATEARDVKQAVSILDRRFDKFLRLIYRLDALETVMSPPISKETQLRIDRDDQIISEAPPEIRKLDKAFDYVVTGTALFNSPGLIVIMLLLLPIVIVAVLICVATNRLKSLVDALSKKMGGSLYLPEQRATC